MWGFRRPTPRGRTESCTLRILTDALTSAHGKHCMWGFTTQAFSYSRRLAHSRRAWGSRRGVAAFLSVVPQGALSPCLFFTILSREPLKSIRRMRGVQDSVLPEGCGGEASPHISPAPLIHSVLWIRRCSRYGYGGSGSVGSRCLGCPR